MKLIGLDPLDITLYLQDPLIGLTTVQSNELISSKGLPTTDIPRTSGKYCSKLKTCQQVTDNFKLHNSVS
jgi:hypothetical protein